MSNESSSMRYRPAVFTLIAVAAGLSLYYVRQSFYNQPAGLHRSNAIHRRSHRRHSGRNTQIGRNNPTNADEAGSLTLHMDAAQLMNMLDLELSREQNVDLNAVRSIDIDLSLTNPRLRFRASEAPVRQYLNNVERYERGSTGRLEYEKAFLRVFLAARVPIRTLLIDPLGYDEFVSRLLGPSSSRRTYFTDRDAVLSSVVTFNNRNLDSAFEANRLHSSLSSPQATTPEVSELTEFLPTNHHIGGARGEHAIDSSNVEFGQGNHGHHSVAQETALGSPGSTIDEESDESITGEDNEDIRRDGQSLLNILYHIAEDQSRRDGYVHRGVGCNSCGMTPIKGVRYRCSNCPDYDLCEQCESMQLHTKTHLFYKIRIPAPFFNSTRHPQAPRYPGKLAHLPNHLSRDTIKGLGKDSGLEIAELEALWDQFKCLAATEFHDDSLGFRMAINRDVFDQCFLPGPLQRRNPPNMPIHDRIFTFFDTDGNGLIGFREFVMGVATIRTQDKDLKLRRIFDCYDADGDGFIRRKDFLRLFWSYYILTKNFTEDALMSMEDDIMEGEPLRETLQGSQPISATFTGSVTSSRRQNILANKDFDAVGDPVVNDDGDLFENDESLIDGEAEILGDFAEVAKFGSIVESLHLPPIIEGKEKEHPVAAMEWPPSYLCQEDVESVLGTTAPYADAVSDPRERLSILSAAASRRKKVRDNAISKREQRRLFYSHRDGLSRSNEPIRTASVNNHSLHGLVKSSSADRIAPPLEADAGQEYLYQILEESMNELLDPLFKCKEDLHVEAILKTKEREKLNHPDYAYFNSQNFRKHCSFDLIPFLRLINNKYMTTDIEFDVTEALKSWIEQWVEPDGEAHGEAMCRLEKHGIIDMSECRERVRRLRQKREAGSESDQSSSSVAAADSRRNHHDSILEANEAIDSTNQSVEGSMLAAELAEGFNIELSRATENLDTPSDQLEQTILETPLDVLLQRSGYSIIEEPVNGESQHSVAPELNDVCNAETPNSSTVEFIKMSSSFTHDEDASDPTLPQNRHSSYPKLERVHHVAPLDETEPHDFPQKRLIWTYLIMLDCLVEQDRCRGGPGSLDFEEFQIIMNGNRGNNLGFLGMFYEMVLF